MRGHGQEIALDGSIAEAQSINSTEVASIVPDEQLQKIEDLLGDLQPEEGIQNDELVEQKLRELEEEVQRLRRQLGLPDQDVDLLDPFQYTGVPGKCAVRVQQRTVEDLTDTDMRKMLVVDQA